MERPTKKPRLHVPDGFQKSKPASRYRPPESITKFISTFDTPAAKPSAPPQKRAIHDRPRNPFIDVDLLREPEAGPSKPSVVTKRPALPSHSPSAAKSNHALPLLKPLKPPVFQQAPLAQAAPQTVDVAPSFKTANATLSSLQPKLKQQSATSEKAWSILKAPAVPIPSSSSTKPSVPLKSLALPPLPERPPSPKKPMKTIFTTNVAQAIDPTKEGAGAELLSLFLQQHGHGFTSSTDRELQRGVMVSPDKRSRCKDPKFVRGGLAECFQHRIACLKTDFSLWRRQMEQKIQTGAKFKSDMQLRIMKVLDVAKVSERSRFMTAPRSGLALCRLTWRDQLMSGDLTLGTYVVVFSFGPTQGGRSAVSSAERLEEGNEVMVWLPWYKVELVDAEGCASLLEMFRTLDSLTPPHSVLIVSRFYIAVPRPPRECDMS